MTHFTRQQLERAMVAYGISSNGAHRSTLELYAVPYLITHEELQLTTDYERQRLTNWLIEDLINIGFMVNDPSRPTGFYSLTRRGIWMAGGTYLFTTSRLVRLWHWVIGTLLYRISWMGV